MDQTEKNQSQGKNQPDAGPDVMQQESPRTCKICGGPNHHGCGCEARAAKAAAVVSTESMDHKPPEPYRKPEDYAEPSTRTTDEEIARTIERSEKMFGHIEGMSDNLSDLHGSVVTVISYLSNIDQHLKEIHVMVKARIRSDADKNKN